MTEEDFILSDLKERYASQPNEKNYARLYATEDKHLSPMFTSFHQRLNDLFDFMNTKTRVNGHYNADQSRALLNLIEELDEVRGVLRRIGMEFKLAPDYENAIKSCREFLRVSGGSPIPEGFELIPIERYGQIFQRADNTVRLKKRDRTYRLQLIGEGSYAVVHKYFDEEYKKFFAIKRAKKGISEKDLKRFRAEYELMRGLSFPYIVEAYTYDEEKNAYTMEYCDGTLGEFIARHNSQLSFDTRKRIALQFLYGVNYLHLRRILHRDISKQNILVKKFDFPAITVKLSDFGLHKDPASDRTFTGSSMKGSIRDPTLESFKDFDVRAEIYAVGHILSFIFSGRESFGSRIGQVQEIIERCTTSRRQERYESMGKIIAEIEVLSAPNGPTPTKPPSS
ncbi:protein kinase [Actinosynnema sp. NPDC023587]|uniref:protein kinase domain-containing protein n=1 Tax=Actinosynnema sp. NPDC023587 TaxID=3154695 RepID=UPI0034066D87